MALNGFSKTASILVICCALVLIYKYITFENDSFYDINVPGVPIQRKIKPGYVRVSGRNRKLIHVYQMSEDIDSRCESYSLDGASGWSICVFSFVEDPIVTAHITLGGSWEQKSVDKMVEWLSEDPGLGLIDLGSNLGVYSLTAAAKGHEVLAVEPFRECNQLLHKSALKSGFMDKVTLLQTAVGDVRGYGSLSVNMEFKSNVSIGEVVTSDDLGYKEPPNLDGFRYTGVVHMNDLLPYCHFKHAILKIDIEGYEHRAFAHAQDLFKNVMIPLVLMNWGHCARILHNEVPHTDDDVTMIGSMVGFLTALHYTPWSVEDDIELKVQDWLEWPLEIYWVKNVHRTKRGDLK